MVQRRPVVRFIGAALLHHAGTPRGGCRSLPPGRLPDDRPRFRADTALPKWRRCRRSIDLFAPSVQPTGPISLGIFDLAQKTHSLTFQVIGKDPDSPYYSFGLDCFSLVPVP